MTEQSPPAQEGLKRQLSQAVAWNAIFTPIKFIADMIATLIKVNLLLPAEFGTISLVSAAAGSAGVWLDLGIESTLPKFIPEAEQSAGRGAARGFLNRILLIKLLLLAVGIIALPLWGGVLLSGIRQEADKLAVKHGAASIAPLLEQLERFGWVFLAAIAALIVLGALYDTLLAYLISFFRQKAWNLLNAFAVLTLPLLTAAAVLLHWGVIGVLAGMVTTALLSVLLTWRHVRRIMHERGDATATPVPRELWKRFLPYTAMAFLITSTDYFSSQYFATLMTSLDGLVSVAIFAVAINFVRQIQGYIYTPMRGIQVPLFTRIRAGGQQQLERVWGTLVRLLLVLLIPAAVGLSLLMYTLLVVQFQRSLGDGGSLAVEAANVGLILVPFLFTEPLWGLGHNLLMVDEAYRPIIVSRLCALISIPLMIILPPQIGLAGVAIAVGASKLLAGLVAFGMAMYRFKLRLPWVFGAKVVVASAVMGGVIMLGLRLAGTIAPNASLGERVGYLGVAVGLTVLGAGLFVLLARLLKLFSADDRALISELRNPMARRLARLL